MNFKIPLTMVLLSALIVSCATGSKTGDGSSGSLRAYNIVLPGFLDLTSEDLKALDGATKPGAVPTKVVLSDSRTASCEKQACELTGSKAGITATVSRADLDEVLYLHREASRQAMPTTIQNGPVTLRCTPVRCTGDFRYVTEQKVSASEVNDVVLPGFVKEIIRKN